MYVYTHTHVCVYMCVFLKGSHTNWAEPHKNHSLTKISVPGMRNLQIVGPRSVTDSPQMPTIAAALGCLSEVVGKALVLKTL